LSSEDYDSEKKYASYFYIWENGMEKHIFTERLAERLDALAYNREEQGGFPSYRFARYPVAIP
jgi:hypothetical protein